MTRFISVLGGGMAVAMVCAVAVLVKDRPPAALDAQPHGEVGALARQIERLADSFERIAKRNSMRAVLPAIEREPIAMPAAAHATPLDASGIVEQLRGLRHDLRRYGREAPLGDAHLRYGPTRLGNVQAFLDTCKPRGNAHNDLQLLSAEQMLERFGRPSNCRVDQAGAMCWHYEGAGDASFSVTFYDGAVMNVEYYIPD